MAPLDALIRPGGPARPEDQARETTQSGPVPLPLVAPVHDCVPGRVRWRVIGLRGNPALKTLLEARLPELPGVHTVHASVETGRVLTLFDPAVSVERVRDRIT